MPDTKYVKLFEDLNESDITRKLVDDDSFSKPKSNQYKGADKYPVGKEIKSNDDVLYKVIAVNAHNKMKDIYTKRKQEKTFRSHQSHIEASGEKTSLPVILVEVIDPGSLHIPKQSLHIYPLQTVSSQPHWKL